MWFACAVFIACAYQRAAKARVLRLETSGVDAGDCSPSAPCASLYYAISQALVSR